jgi:hypothetical protein
MPKKRILPRIFLHHGPLLCGVSGNEGLGLAGLCLRLRVDWRTNMAMLLVATGIRASDMGGMPHHPVVVKVVVAVSADFTEV